MNHIFTELSLVIVLVAIVSLIMRLLRQPLILGYIFTGLLVGPSALGLIHSPETFEAFSEIGIALLLFIIGLEMNIAVIKRLGKPVFITAFSTLAIAGTVGFITSMLFGFTKTESIIIGLALFFSSTIIIVKVLSDKKENNRLHGQIAIGVILVEDIIATFALLFIAAGKDGGISPGTIAALGLKGLALAALLTLSTTLILPNVLKKIAVSQEMLFLFAIGWGFGIASLFEYAGFSIEVGALFAGVALAPLPYSQEIGSRLKPLRDFFIVLFFIVLGERLVLDNLTAGIVPALVLSLVVMTLKPFAVMLSLGLLGYTKRVSFKAGVNLSQISEFSIILVVLAASNGMVGPNISAIITLVAIATIASSTYLMHFDNQLFTRFDKIRIALFERRANSPKEKRPQHQYQLLLFGYQKGGHEFAKTFKQMNKNYAVVDYDPEVVEVMTAQGIPFVYGDANDIELLDEIGVHSAKLIVSTVTDFETTQNLTRHVASHNEHAVLIVHADNQEEAEKLYELGSSYVMMPHYIGSEKISSFIKKSNLKKSEFKKFRDKHLAYLAAHKAPEPEKRRRKIGHAILERLETPIYPNTKKH